MLKLAYIVQSNISTSETFIYDLVEGLSSKPNIDLTYISGASTKNKLNSKYRLIPTGFADSHLVTAARLKKIGNMLGDRGSKWKMSFNQQVAFRKLTSSKLPLMDVAYVEYATTGVLVMTYLEKNRIPFVLHVHGYDVTTCLNDLAFAKQLPCLFKKADHIITPSHHLRRVLITLGCDASKITAIYPVTDLSRIPEPNFVPREHQAPSIIFLGRLTDKKNPLALVHALNLVREKVPNVKLKILGDGPLRSKTEMLIRELNLQNNIEHLGAVNQDKAFFHLSRADIYAQHSVTSISGDQEGFPVSLAEAAAFSLPLVSTIHSGITENIQEGKTGFLVQEYDFETMAERIIYLIKNPKIAKQMGKAGREHILKLCKPGTRVDKITTLLFEVAGQRP